MTVFGFIMFFVLVWAFSAQAKEESRKEIEELKEALRRSEERSKRFKDLP